MKASEGRRGLSPGFQGCMYPRGGPASLLHRNRKLGQQGQASNERANLGNTKHHVKHYPKKPYDRARLFLRANSNGWKFVTLQRPIAWKARPSHAWGEAPTRYP
jgi:hypothetical protein